MVRSDLRMKRYELLLVAHPDFPGSDTRKVSELVKKTVGEDGVVVKSVSVLGKKTLAYPIKKLTEGIYFVVELEANSIDVAKLQKQANLGNNVIRFLLTVKE